MRGAWAFKGEGGQNCDAPNPENINVMLIKFEKKKSLEYDVAKVMSKYNVTDYQAFCFSKCRRPSEC